MSERQRSVGVIGTGAMGMGVVRSLRRANVRTFTRDIRAEADREALSLGATPCASPADVATHADIVIVLVVDDVQVDDVLFGANGAAPALADGGIVVLSSTLDPAYVASVSMRLEAGHVDLLDAPVSGGPARASEGTMTMMLAGPKRARSRCDQVLSRIAGRVFHVGERAGQAATFKIVNNLLAAVNLAAAAEALTLARKAGLDPRAALDVILASSGASWMTADRMPRVLSGDASVRAATKILAKDAALAASLGDRLEVDVPFAYAARRAFADAVGAGFGEHDDASMLTFFAQRAGVTFDDEGGVR